MFHVEQKINQYLNLLFNYNDQVNLISRKISRDDVELLIKESFLISKYLIDEVEVADVGSGNGLLGIPLSIKFPNINFDLVEPLKKKTDFLNKFKNDLYLNKLNIFTKKIESYIEMKNKIDVIVARGFPYNEIFAEYICRGFARKVVLITSKNKFEKLKGMFGNRINFSEELIPWRDNLIILKMENVSRGTKKKKL